MYSAKETANRYMETGRGKASMPLLRMLLMGVLAGMLLALAAVGAGTASCMVENPGTTRIVSALVFPAGLALIVFLGAELFTGNCLLIMPVLEKQISFGRMAVSWAAVYLGNFLGSALMAFLVCESGQMSGFSGAVAGNAIRAAVTKTSLDPGKAVLLGILCNFLVCAAVFISMMGTTVADKLLGLYFPIMLFVLGGFEHSVANMYYIPAGLFAAAKPEYAALAAAQGISLDGLTWQSFFLGNLLPVTVGNVLGGAALGVLLWGAYLWKGKRA